MTKNSRKIMLEEIDYRIEEITMCSGDHPEDVEYGKEVTTALRELRTIVWHIQTSEGE